MIWLVNVRGAQTQRRFQVNGFNLETNLCENANFSIITYLYNIYMEHAKTAKWEKCHDNSAAREIHRLSKEHDVRLLLTLVWRVECEMLLVGTQKSKWKLRWKWSPEHTGKV